MERMAMPKDQLVSDLAEAKANIDRFEHELARSADLQALMSYSRAWYGNLATDGSWRVAPSKFAGYVANNAEAYVHLHRRRDGRRTERALSTWFDTIEPGSAAYEDITAAVLRLFAKYGRAPNKRLRVNAVKSERNSTAQKQSIAKLDRALFRSRITFDARVCGGRPCIRGMRIRVSDVLDMLSAGATRQEILDDYPYLEDDDITAALEYAAESAGHRVVSAA
jgi:uncharacterized protein (DUF433 family)